MEERLDYIDETKGIAIFFMLLSHCIAKTNILRMWITSFNMPLFFMISGILFAYNKSEKNNFNNIIRNKMKKLAIPYFTFCVTLSLFYTLLKFIEHKDFITSMQIYLVDIITLKGIESLWFIPCIFITYIIFWFFIKNTNRINTYIISVFICCISISLNKFIDYLFIPVLIKSGVALIFFSFGHMIFSHIKHKDFSFIEIVIINTINGIIFIFNGEVGLGGFKLNNPILYIICGIVGSLGIILLVKKINSRQCKLLKFLGNNTIIVLCTNNIIIEILRLFDYKFLGNIFIDLGILGDIIFFTFILVIEIFIITISNKYFYYLFGIKKENIYKVIK
ncbi:acyltransferase family protein [Intestinibacter sp.]